jgi:hypothetical protein
MGFLDLRQINTSRKVPLQVNFLDDDTLHFLLKVFFVIIHVGMHESAGYRVAVSGFCSCIK